MRMISFAVPLMELPRSNDLRYFKRSAQRIKNEAVSAIVSPNKTAAVLYSVPSFEKRENKMTMEVILITCSAI